jgi:hypothetical protein
MTGLFRRVALAVHEAGMLTGAQIYQQFGGPFATPEQVRNAIKNAIVERWIKGVCAAKLNLTAEYRPHLPVHEKRSTFVPLPPPPPPEPVLPEPPPAAGPATHQYPAARASRDDKIIDYAAADDRFACKIAGDRYSDAAYLAPRRGPKRAGPLGQSLKNGERMPPEQHLWVAVLLRAVLDATEDDDVVRGRAMVEHNVRRRKGLGCPPFRVLYDAAAVDRRAARNWLQNGENRGMIADLSGYGADTLDRMVARLRANDWKPVGVDLGEQMDRLAALDRELAR